MNQSRGRRSAGAAARQSQHQRHDCARAHARGARQAGAQMCVCHLSSPRHSALHLQLRVCARLALQFLIHLFTPPWHSHATPRRRTHPSLLSAAASIRLEVHAAGAARVSASHNASCGAPPPSALVCDQPHLARGDTEHSDTHRQVILIYLVIGVIFIPVGAKCLITSRSVRLTASPSLWPPPQVTACPCTPSAALTCTHWPPPPGGRGVRAL